MMMQLLLTEQSIPMRINMDWENLLYTPEEMPLDRLVEGYSYTSIFRTIAFIGDSLSSGEFETCDEQGNKGYHDMFDYSWGQYIARKNGLKAYNFSRGGMTAREYLDSFAQVNGFWDEDKKCQAYVIALGVNDVYNGGLEVGGVEDIDSDDYRNNKPTFIGNYAQIISRYKEISPDAKFFFVTFPNDEVRGNEEQTRKVINALYDLTKIFSNSYVIDLFKYGPVYDERFRKQFFLYGHMNPMGYIFTANIIDSYIDYIVRKNPDDFKNIAFINTDIKYK